MPELSPEERIKLAVSFIEQSPPGEVNDVVNAIRAIVNDDDALMPHAVPALRAYNLAQLQVVEHTATDGAPAHSSLISESLIVPASSPERFYDHAYSRTFVFDHVALLASDYQPVELPPADAAFRAALAESLGKYTRNHFPAGQASVSTNQVPLPAPAPPSPSSSIAGSDMDAAQASQALASSSPPPSSPPADEDMPSETDIPGIEEKEPTPLAGPPEVSLRATDEVDADGGLEKLDEEVGEAKAKDETMGEGGGDETPVERHPSGIAEEDPTPLDGSPVRRSLDEVDAEGGLARLDEEVTGAKTEMEAGEEPEIHEEKEERALAAEDAEDTSGPAPAPKLKVETAEPHPPLENPTFTLEIVGNRFNPSNFWTGRWRTRWVVDRAAGRVEGNIKIDVHYYEQGNVQLATDHNASFELPADAGTDIAALASAVVTNIGRIETEYQLEIGDVYKTLGDKAFRALRRALPVTRQRVDWDKVSGYSIGSDISKAFA